MPFLFCKLLNLNAALPKARKGLNATEKMILTNSLLAIFRKEKNKMTCSISSQNILPGQEAPTCTPLAGWGWVLQVLVIYVQV